VNRCHRGCYVGPTAGGQGLRGWLNGQVKITMTHSTVPPISRKLRGHNCPRHRSSQFGTKVDISAQFRQGLNRQVSFVAHCWRIGQSAQVQKRVLPKRILENPEEETGCAIQQLDAIWRCAEQLSILTPLDLKPSKIVTEFREYGTHSRTEHGDVFSSDLFSALFVGHDFFVGLTTQLSRGAQRRRLQRRVRQALPGRARFREPI